MNIGYAVRGAIPDTDSWQVMLLLQCTTSTKSYEQRVFLVCWQHYGVGQQIRLQLDDVSMANGWWRCNCLSCHIRVEDYLFVAWCGDIGGIQILLLGSYLFWVYNHGRAAPKWTSHCGHPYNCLFVFYVAPVIFGPVIFHLSKFHAVL